MTLQQLTYVLEAARHKSFSAAAEALLMAQPSLSEQVRRLEAELGVPLFIRAGRGLELTDAGRLLVPQAEVADAVRDGGLEAGLVVLPLDDAGLETRVMAHEAQLYLSPEPERVKAPVTIQEIGSASVLRARGYARRLHAAELDPPMFATYAFIMRRNAHLSPATREFMRLAERRLQALV